MRRSLLRAMLLSLTTLPGSAQGTATSGEVSGAVTCFPENWNRHDDTGLAQCFTADADRVNVASQRWKGRGFDSQES